METVTAAKEKQVVPAVHPEFRCVVVSPVGKLLDCATTSVVFPAHDGKVGILYNHIPMFCKLDVGVMKITGIPPDVDTPLQVTYFLIKGGFALLAANVLTIMAFDAAPLEDYDAEKMYLLKWPETGKSSVVGV